MAGRPHAVIFDMDGVLFRYDFPRRLEGLAAASGVAAPLIEEVIWRQGFDEDGDRGRYTARAYLEGFCDRIGATISAEQWLEARAAAMTPDRAVLALARGVKRRAAVAMLSNNGPLLEAGIADIFPEIVDIFGENAFFSCEFGAAKPDRSVFLGVLARLAVAPGDALFVDDTESYVRGAAAAGLRTHRFRSAAALRRELEANGLL